MKSGTHRLLTPSALRSLDRTVVAILRERHPGVLWQVESLEGNPLSAPGQIAGSLPVQEDDDPLLDRSATVREDDDDIEG